MLGIISIPDTYEKVWNQKGILEMLWNCLDSANYNWRDWSYGHDRCRNVWTGNGGSKWYTNKAAQKREVNTGEARAERKKFEKTFRKGIDKRKVMQYNNKVARQRAA